MGMALAKEVGRAQKIGHLDDGVGIDEQCAQHRALGFQIGGN
jgi:hypothetical protein